MSEMRTKLMLTAVTIRKYEARKQDKAVTAEVNESKHARSGAARVNKDLFTKEAMAKVNEAASAARLVHYKYTMPWSDEGYRILTTDLYSEFLANISICRQNFLTAAVEFIKNYEGHKADAQIHLGNMWNEDDYLPAADLVNKFSFDVKLMPLPQASDFRVDIADDEIKMIQADIEQRVTASLADGLKAPIEKLFKAVSAMSEKLSDPEAQFQYTLIENVRDIAALLPRFNFVNDPHINQLAADAQQLTRFSADQLRTNPAARQQVVTHANSLINKAQSWL